MELGWPPSMGALVVAIALLAGIVYLKLAIAAGCRSDPGDALRHVSELSQQRRLERADDARERVSPLPRYIVAGVGFGTAAALLAHVVPPSIAYAILCLALVARCVADQIAEERAPRRRSALLGRSRRIDPVLVTWIGLTVVSSLLLIPWLLNKADQAVAFVVAGCVVLMIAVAWRIASAPPLLFGNDLEAEQVVDRETRAIRTGDTCVIIVGVVALFIGFVGGAEGAPSFAHHRGEIGPALLLVWAGLFAWRLIYARRLSRTPLAS